MSIEALKLELIEWLSKLDDAAVINQLRVVKESSNSDWWNVLSEEQKEGVMRGIRDIDEGRFTTHDEVKKKYGL